MKKMNEPEIRLLASRILAELDEEPSLAARPGFADRVENAFRRETARALLPVPPWWLFAGAALLLFLSVNVFIAFRSNPASQISLVAELSDAYITQGVASSQALSLR